MRERLSGEFGRRGSADFWVTVVCAVVLVAGLVWMLRPSLGGGGISPRSACGANCRGIMQSMNVYASDNEGRFPVLPFAVRGVTNRGTLDGTVEATDAKGAVRSMYGGSGAQDGSVLASVWLLVLENYTSPKQYYCMGDPYVDPKRPGAALTEGSGEWHVNFQSPRQESYSFAYPWQADGTVGKWWTATEDAELPLMSDMAPMSGTGVPVRNVSPGAMPKVPRSWNTGNHHGDGQDVGFADGHAEFVRRPNCGQGGDNIFTVSGVKGVSEFGGTQPGKGAIEVMTKRAPFDVVMVPVRNLDTGRF